MTERAKVLELLRAHGARPLCRDEALAVAQAIAFVETHPGGLLRSCLSGHLTGSAWIVSPDRRQVLLTLHRKLGKWLQLGGHADGNPDLLAVALREAREESGLGPVTAVEPGIFDVDRHWIPGRRGEPGHWHYDVRFLFEADPSLALTITNESRALSWVEVAAVLKLNPEASMARMVQKTLAMG
jgi:8-oxo-dGTP pyrophosphatase MutT (NUDIX family)